MLERQSGPSQPLSVVVFCGPPCAGKSHVLEQFKNSTFAHQRFPGELWAHEMDQIRLEQFPGELNDWPKRNAAYRILHFEASKQLLAGRSVAVTATYIPQHARTELAAIVQRFQAKLHVIQCVCSPEEAVRRFNSRNAQSASRPHAGSDLQVAKVKSGAESYQRFEGAMTLDTTPPIPAHEVLARVCSYLSKDEPVHPIEWACHDYRISTPSASLEPAKQLTKLLSSIAIKKTIRGRIWESTKVPLLIALPLAIGLTPMLFSGVGHLMRIIVAHSWALSKVLPSFAPVPAAEWGSFWIACAGISGLFIAYRDATAQKRRERDEFLSSGTVGLYPIPPEGTQEPSDLEVYCSYRCRMDQDQTERMPIAGVPVFLLQTPRRGFSFHARIEPSSVPIEDVIPSEAKTMGFDWIAFRDARKQEFIQRSARGMGAEAGIGCNENPILKGNVYWIKGVKREYYDQVAREQAVRFFSPGILPDMRRLFEGQAWDKGSLNLLNCREAARRYSMFISITGLVLTSDNYFILQRRSERVSTGMNNLNASVAGSADFKRDRRRLRGEWDLEKTITRELEEEIGIRSSDLTFEERGAFIGAGFNLRYGRDLNLYGLAYLTKSAEDFCSERLQVIEHSDRILGRFARSVVNRRVRDKWEVDRIELLHKDEVTLGAITNGDLARRLKWPSRHLMGALYCWAVFSEGEPTSHPMIRAI